MRVPTTIRIAWRNLWRSPRRTVLALAAIGLSQALVLFIGGIYEGYAAWMVETITGPLMGHVQAHAPEWRKDRAMDRVLHDADSVVAALRRDPGVASVSARVVAPALIAAGREGFAGVVFGLEPAEEAGAAGLLRGAPAVPEDRRVLMGRGFAGMMDVKVGDTLAIVGQGADGSIANELVVVAGLLDGPVDVVNRMGVVMALPAARAVFAMPDAAHEIVIRVRDPRATAAVMTRARALPGLAGAEVLDWERLAPELVDLVRLARAAWWFILVLVFIAAAAGVANTMLMATFERTREFGMLLALGVTPGRIVRMLVSESVTLGVTGAALGTVLGLGLVMLTHRTGLDLSVLAEGAPGQLSFAGMSISMRLYPVPSLVQTVGGIAAVVVVALLASLWPAARAGRLAPAEAMRS